MNDTQRLDWLERNPWRLLVCSAEGNETYKFRLLLKADPSHSTALDYSGYYDTLREVLDEGMKG